MNRKAQGVRLRLGIAVVLSCCLVGAMDGGSYSWTTAGPEVGTVRQIVVDPQRPSRLLATAGYYGPYLFDTPNRGANWSYVEGVPVGFGRIVTDPVNAGVMYSPTYGGVLKSTNSGRSWSSASNGLPASATITAVAVAPSAPSTLYAVTSGSPASVYRSFDGGASWALASSGIAAYYVADLACDPSNAAVLYAISDTDVLKSVDAGSSFLPTGLNRPARRLLVDPRPPATIYAGTTDGGVFASQDGSASWSAANGGIADVFIWDLALDPANRLRMYAAGQTSGAASGGLYVTSDGGKSWHPVDLGSAVTSATAVAVDPSDASRVYVGAGTGLLRESLYASSDAGATWALSDQGLSGYYSYAVAGHPAAGASAFGVSGSRVYATGDSGASWTLRGTADFALTSLVIDPSAPEILYVGYGAGVLKSVDGGATWNPASDGLNTTQLRRLAISGLAPGHLLAGTQDGLFATSDGGGLWSPLLSGDVRAAAYDPSDAAILYAGRIVGDGDFGLLRSSDNGLTWAPPAGIAAGYMHLNDLSVSAAEPQRVYAASSGSVLRSVDRGLTFAPANTGLPTIPGIAPFRLAADPERPGTLYMLAGLGGDAASDGAGAPDIPPPGPTDPVFGNVFRTTDGADSWTQLPGSLPVLGELDLSIGATGRVLYAATVSGIFQFERSFRDVPDADPFWASIDAAAMNGVSSGCGGGNFCSSSPTSRASVSVFLLRGRGGVAYAPPPATGDVFGDVAAGSPAADFIEELAHEGITAGCGGGNYCPAAALTRADMAVLLLKTVHGADYAPPPATGAVFTDVPADAFAAAWIEQLYAEGISAGCGQGAYCPSAPLSRAQAAALVVRAFGLS